MRQLGIALLILLAVALIAYRALMPFTPAWIDIAFIGVCVVFLILMRLAVRNNTNDTPSGANQPPDKN
jgi:membrane protein implicated in regulation of membrane protease activity